MSQNAFDAARFVNAQHDCYDAVLAELRAGRKRSHWMCFVFPQLGVLGRSVTARHFGLAALQDAKSYSAHPVLGARLRECSTLLLALSDRTAHGIFGSPDDLKLCSSMTLFELAVPQETAFPAVLERFFNGARDRLTLAALHADAGGSHRPPPRPPASSDGVG